MAAVAVFSPPALALPHDLRANRARLRQSQLGWLKPTPADTPIEKIRRLLREDSYVYVKGLLPRQDVLDMRAFYFSQFQHTGMLKEGASIEDGIYSGDDSGQHIGIGGGVIADTEEKKVLVETHRQEFYRTFVRHPQLRKMVRDLMLWDEEVLLQRTMLRHNVPGGDGTGVHYDKLFLRDGEATFLTGWVPIGDCRANGGGLIYLEDSEKLGKDIEDDFYERAEHNGFTHEEKINAFNRNMDTVLGVLNNNPDEFVDQYGSRVSKKMGEERVVYKWLTANYEAGDVVFHMPHTIHASCSNEDKDSMIRLSTDLRFYDKKDWDAGLGDERWMKWWVPGDGL